MVPKYIKLKEKINDDILSGVYSIGSKLPTENQIADIYHVSRSTVRQTLALLVEDGIISKRWGSGNTVISKSDTSKQKTIMVLINKTKVSYITSALEDLNSILMKEGYNLEIKETKNQYSLEREYLSSMLNEVYGGLIISPALSSFPSTNVDLLQLLLKRQLPIIFLGSAPAGLYNPSIVCFNDYDKGYQMARRFINSGKKDIGGIFLQDDANSIQAFSGYIDAIRDAGLTINDSCFMWCNSIDPQGINTRTSSAINRFLKNALDNASAIYVDDHTINVEESDCVFKCSLKPSKPLGKEIAKAFLALKKNGNSDTITIPYK